MPSGHYKRPRTRKAIFPIGPSIAYLPLSRRGVYSLLDWDDAVQAERWNWCRCPDKHTTYAVRRINQNENISLHRFVCPTNDKVDHINHNGLDNRRANLRPADNAENLWNTRMLKTNSTGVMGVNWNKRGSRWHAQIMCRGKKYHLGFFIIFAEAVAARRSAEIRRRSGEPIK